MASTGSSSSAPPADAAPASADLVIGVPTYNHADTIAPVLATVRAGAADCGAAGRVSIVVADGGSADGTVDRARAAAGDEVPLLTVAYPLEPADRLSVPYHGLPGRPRALRAILDTARTLQARACLVLDARISSLEPAWIAALAGPILDAAYDLVAPRYQRHAYEGAITKAIVGPMCRVLWGARLRQPAVGEFAASSRLIQHYLDQPVWQTEGARVGIDMWLVATAVCEGFKVCEVALGPRTYEAGDDASDLSSTLAQITGSVFAELERRVTFWQRLRGSTAVPLFGQPGPRAMPEPPINVPRLLDSFRLGYRELHDLWTVVLPPRCILDFKKLAEQPPERFQLDDRLWARTIYDFALGYRLRVIGRDHLLRSLTPLYLGWVASFVTEIQQGRAPDLDDRLEQIGLAFEAEKAYLISRWRWPERTRR